MPISMDYFPSLLMPYSEFSTYSSSSYDLLLTITTYIHFLILIFHHLSLPKSMSIHQFTPTTHSSVYSTSYFPPSTTYTSSSPSHS